MRVACAVAAVALTIASRLHLLASASQSLHLCVSSTGRGWSCAQVRPSQPLHMTLQLRHRLLQLCSMPHIAGAKVRCADGCYCVCRCQTCQRCLDNFTDTRPAAADSPDAVATAFRATCITKGRASADCDRVDKAIRSSLKGNLGRRLGGVCRLLGECDAVLANNNTCELTVSGRSGTLSECLQEGVSTGTAVAGITTGGCLPGQQCFLLCHTTKRTCWVHEDVGRSCALLLTLLWVNGTLSLL
jgi:hypothetical protein